MSASANDFDDAMATARGRLMALERAAEDLPGLRDVDDAARLRQGLLEALTAELGPERETT